MIDQPMGLHLSGLHDRRGTLTSFAYRSAFWLIHRQFLVVFLDGWSKTRQT
jgi:hypothetical protein